jgi:hypothetical protein
MSKTNHSFFSNFPFWPAFFCAQVHLTVMIACLRLDSQFSADSFCAQAADLVSTPFSISAVGIYFRSIRCRRMSILAYICSSLDSRLLGHFSRIWGPSKSLLKYDTFSLSNLHIPGPEAPRLIFLNLGCQM